MYTSFFGLNEKPFAITPDPRYLFMSERHGEGLAHLLYGVTDSGGFIQLTGEVGTGKTTLVRSLLSQLPNEVDVALILNPQISVVEFLQAICKELGVALPEDRHSPMALVDALNRHLLEAHSQGRRIILMVDEAQNLATDVLEQLRLLTNLETAKQKLLQIILIGQPELREVLAQNNLRQLAQRVTGRYHLEPLTRDEAGRYIEHRLRVAGAVADIFEADAKREVHKLSGGIPRLMNVICDRALLGAYSQERRQVDRDTVRRAAAEISGDEPAAKKPSSALRWVAGLAALGLAAALGFGVAQWQGTGRMPLIDGGAPAPALTAAEVEPDSEPLEDAGAAEATAQAGNAGDFVSRLASGDLFTGSDDAMTSLLALWGIELDPAAGGGCAQAERAGLRCLTERGSWPLLRQLDRPAMLRLVDGEGQAHDVVLTGLDGGEAMLRVGELDIAAPVTELGDLWFGQFTLLWRPPADAPPAIMPGSRGPAVVWLRQSLGKLAGDLAAAGSASDVYDATLEARVREFQREHRLLVDGIAGEQTQIIINSRLDTGAAPRLSGDS